MSLKSRLLKIKYFLFGKRVEKFWELSEIDAERGMSLVQGDHKGRVYIQKKLKEYDLEKYKRLKKRPVDNTPKIYHLFENDGELTVLEGFVRGDSLEFLLKKNGLMDANRVIDIARQLCTILNDYHNYNPPIMGHNLNPANVKLSVNGVVSLMELNIDKYNRKDAKVENLPEHQRYIDPASCGVPADIYSLGVLMNVLLCGKHPEDAIADSVLAEVIAKCVSQPEERYADPMELSAELKKLKDSLSFKQRLSGWKRYLIPGFRGKSAYLWLFAAAAYPMLLYVSLFVKFDGANAWGFLSRILFCLTVLAMVFFDGNYLNIQKRIPLVRSRRRIIRFFGMLLANALLMLVLLLSLNLLPMILNLF